MRRVHRALMILALVAGFAGCSEQHFRAETTWHSDGRVERAIYQPSEFFPHEAQPAWEAVAAAPEIAAESFTGQIRDQAAPTDSDPSYLIAWGTFLSPSTIPESLKFPTPDPAKIGTLRRYADVRHWGLVDEYVWTETLTDVVSLPDLELARREAAGLAADLVEDTLSDSQQHYDITGLLDWLRGDAAIWFAESHAVLVEAAIQRTMRKDDAGTLPERLATVAERYGLKLKDGNGRLLEEPEFGLAVERFLVVRMRELVRTLDGKPIDEAAARQLLAKLGVTKDESLKFEPSAGLQEAIVARFGSEEAASAKGAELATRLFGVYQLGFFLPRRPFHYEMTVPGSIVETSGEILDENRVVWRFDAAEAFPFGYTMAVRSLTPNDAAQQAMLGEIRLKSLQEFSEYARLVKSDANLVAVVQQCVQAGSLRPLEEYEKTLQESTGTDAGVLERTAAFRRLIGGNSRSK